MSFFGGSNKPNAYDSEITVGNICAILVDSKYDSGLDPTTTANTIIDLYNYFTHNKNLRIRLPAPVSDPDDSYCFMWPEGAKTSSRAPSNSSAMYKGRYLSNYNTEKARNRASSVVSSSKVSSRHIGFVDDGSDNDNSTHSNKQHKHSSSNHKHNNSEKHKRQNSSKSSSNGSNIMRINGQVMKPTTSMEQILGSPKVHDDEDKEEDEIEAPRPPALRRQAKFTGFAEDE